MTTFSEILDAASSLSADEQQTLVEIIGRRLAERSRAELLQEVKAARAEIADGSARIASVADIMDEVRGETQARSHEWIRSCREALCEEESTERQRC
jgi:hypothetical protein